VKKCKIVGSDLSPEKTKMEGEEVDLYREIKRMNEENIFKLDCKTWIYRERRCNREYGRREQKKLPLKGLG